MKYKTCYEYKGCSKVDRPGYGSEDDQCWVTPRTLCGDGTPRTLEMKKKDCFSSCQYFKDRQALKLGIADADVMKRICK